MIEEFKGQKREVLFAGYIYAIVLLSTIIGGIVSEHSIMDILKNVIISVIGLGIYFLFMDNNGCILKNIKNVIMYCIVFALSNILIVVQSKVYLGVAWIIGIAFAAYFEKAICAVSTYGILMLQYTLIVFVQDKNIDRFIIAAILGIAVVYIFLRIESIRNVPYAMVELITLTAILFITLHEFDIKSIHKDISGITILIICDIVFMLPLALSYPYNRCKEILEKNYKKKMQKKLMAVLEADYELIKRLQEYSATLFIHSMKVSMLSRDAAQAIGADEILAQAGGMYHEIGRINNEKDYIDAGVEIAVIYGFPKELIDIIKLHSKGFEKPKSKESAILMLSDCILSTNEYLEEKGERDLISDKKLIEGIFNNRMEKGTLDEVKFTDEEIKVLKEFYINNAFKKEATEL